LPDLLFDEFHPKFKYMKIVAEVILIPILSEGIGYGIFFGVGLVIAIVVRMVVRTESKWLGTKKTFEWFYTAGRNVKSGLSAAAVVSP
jgi:urea-proton symporter